MNPHHVLKIPDRRSTLSSGSVLYRPSSRPTPWITIIRWKYNKFNLFAKAFYNGREAFITFPPFFPRFFFSRWTKKHLRRKLPQDKTRMFINDLLKSQRMNPVSMKTLEVFLSWGVGEGKRVEKWIYKLMKRRACLIKKAVMSIPFD